MKHALPTSLRHRTLLACGIALPALLGACAAPGEGAPPDPFTTEFVRPGGSDESGNDEGGGGQGSGNASTQQDDSNTDTSSTPGDQSDGTSPNGESQGQPDQIADNTDPGDGTPNATDGGETTDLGGEAAGQNDEAPDPEAPDPNADDGAPEAEAPIPDPNGTGYTPPPNLTGGASAAFVCPPGQTYGDPLAGVTEADVQSFGAPDGDFFAFLEGPIWVAELGTVFFSDNARNPERIYQLTPPSTQTQLFKGDAGSNGLALDASNQIIAADEFSNQITRIDPISGQASVILPLAGTATPNDLIVRSDGNLYFTDPSRGLFHLAIDGTLSGPINQSNSPAPVSSANGVVLSTDETRLLVGSVFNNTISSFSLTTNGSIEVDSGELFATTQGGTVDGMAVDCAGNLYAGTSSGVEVYSPQGTRIGVVPTGYSSNCTFGGADRRTLYVTSQGQLKAVTLGVPGLPN